MNVERSDTHPPSQHPRAANGRIPFRLIAALAVVGLALQLALPSCADVSWLFVLADKMLSGQRLYIDVIETNPPMTVFLYMPAVMLERLTGIPAEWNEIAITFATIAFGLGLAALIMRQSGRAGATGTYLVAGVQAMAILPMMVFSQREHFAAVLVLPSLALLVARAEGYRVSLGMALAAGAGAGLAATIKPHFAAAVLLPALYVAFRLRSVRSLVCPEHLMSAAIVTVYAAVIVLWFPVYIDTVLPLVADTYRVARYSVGALLLHPQMLMAVGIGLATLLIAGVEGRKPSLIVPLLAASGFLFAFFEQGKAWRYHLFPAIALAYMVGYIELAPRLSALLAPPFKPDGKALLSAAGGGLALAGMIALMPYFWFLDRSGLPLVAAVERVAPHPRVLAASFYMIGHPLTRMVGGSWVGTYSNQWLGPIAQFRSEQPGIDEPTRARMLGLVAADRATLLHDIRVGRPDVILVDRQDGSWDEAIASTPGLAEALGAYTKAADADDIDLLVRRELIRDAAPSAAVRPAP